MHLLYLQEQRLRIPLGGETQTEKRKGASQKTYVVTNHSKETRRWASAPVRMGRLLGGGENESERGLEGEKSGGKLWDDYVTVSRKRTDS